MSAKQVRFRSGSSEKKFGLQYKFGFSEGKKKAPGNFSSTYGTPRGTHVLIPLPQLQEHVNEVWVLRTGPNTHTHMITPAPYGCITHIDTNYHGNMGIEYAAGFLLFFIDTVKTAFLW